MDAKQRLRSSNKLCILIQDEDCDEEKFLRLAGEGADINFKNPLENGSTPLHLAVEGSKYNWVALLLKKGSDATIENDDGKTPLMLAHEIANEHVTNLFKTRSFKMIAKTFVREITFADLKKLKSSEAEFNVLEIKMCPSFKDFVEQNEFLELRECLFVIILDVASFEESGLTELSEKLRQPLILQVNTNESTKIYAKRENLCFFELSFENFDPASLQTALSQKEKFHFEFICKWLHSMPEWARLGKDLMQFEVDIGKSFDGWNIVEWAIKSDDLFSLKFLRLFNPCLQEVNEHGKRLLEVAVELGSLESLIILLNVPKMSGNIEALLNPEQRQAINLMSQEDLSLLMTAAKTGKSEFIPFLVVCGLNVNLLNESDQTASDIAFENQNYEVLLQLLDNDSPYPFEFEGDGEIPEIIDGNPRKELEIIKESIDIFHNNIRGNNMEAVEKYVRDNPKTKCAYNFTNQCALSTAVESRNFEIYSYLRSQGFAQGIDANHKSFINKLDVYDREKLKKCNRKFFETNENSTIMELVSKSRLGFGSDQRNFRKIQTFFEALYALPGVQPILKVVANAKNVDIVFDFNRGSIADMDPTQLFDNNLVRGRTIYSVGNILIGAKREDENDILAVIAHELTHYAMFLMYNNDGNPYEVEDETRKDRFEVIVECYDKETRSTNDVIENAYCYAESDIPLELIVRPPQLMATYRNDPEILAAIRETFSELFDFYEDVVLADCNREFPMMKSQTKIQDLNDILGVYNEIESSKIFCLDDFSEIVDKERNILIRSEVPEVILKDILENLKKPHGRKIQSSHIFLRLGHLYDPRFTEMLSRAFHSQKMPKIFMIDSEGTIDVSILEKRFEALNITSRVVLVSKCTQEDLKNQFDSEHNLNYFWPELVQESKDEILRSIINFQGLSMSLSELLSEESVVLYILPLSEVLKLLSLEIKPLTVTNPPVFVEPKIEISKFFGKFELPMFEVLKVLRNERSVIICDVAGMGKTTVAVHIATEFRKAFPGIWVFYFDLKQHTAAFVKDSQEDTGEIGVEFFAKKLIKFKTTLEQKLFEQLYEDSKVFFVFDGFDEVSPVYKKFFLKVIAAVQKSGNSLLVTTRPHLQSILEERMNTEAFRIKPWSYENKIEFLCKYQYWIEHNESIEFRLERYHPNHPVNRFDSNPLHLLMVAEIMSWDGQVPEGNCFTFYNQYVSKKIKLWIEKGPLADLDSEKLQMSSSNIVQIHQKIALQNLFDDALVDSLNLPEIQEPLTEELIVRIGMMTLGENGKLYFMHQSIAEYFVSDFLFANIVDKRMLTYSDGLHEIFVDVLCGERTEIRGFMNAQIQIFPKLSTDVLSGKFTQTLERSWKVRGFILHLMGEKLFDLLEFMLRSLQIDEKEKLGIFNMIVSDGDSLLHWAAAGYSVELFKIFWNCVESFADRSEQIKLLLAPGWYGRNVLCRSASNRNEDMTKFIINSAANLMQGDEFKMLLLDKDEEAQNSLHAAVLRNDSRCFDVMWEVVRGKLSVQETKQILYESGFNEDTLLAYSYGNEFVIKSLQKIAKNIFTPTEVRDYLFATDCFGDTALHLVVWKGNAQVFTNLWAFITDCLEHADQKTILLMKLPHGENIFTKSCKNHNKSVIPKLLSVAKGALGREEFEAALTARNYENKNFLDFVDLASVRGVFTPEEIGWMNSVKDMPVPEGEGAQLLRDLDKAIDENVDTENLKKILYATEFNETTFHLALQFGSIEFVIKLLKFLKKLDDNDLKEILFHKGPKNRSALHRAMANNFIILRITWEFMVANAPCEDVKNMLLEKTDRSGWNLVFGLAFQNMVFIFVALDWFRMNSEWEEVVALFGVRNKLSHNLIQFAAKYCDERFVLRLFDFATETLTREQCARMLLEDLEGGFVFIKNLLRNVTHSAVSRIWDRLEKILTPGELESLFKAMRGRFFGQIDRGVNREAVAELKVILISRLGTEKFQAYFNE